MVIRTLALVFWLSACSQRLVEKEKLRVINEDYERKVYSLREPYKVSAEATLQPGVPYRVYIESTPSLLKLKCYPAEESRESSQGIWVYYLINEQAGKKKFEREDLDKIVDKMFEPFEKKSKSPSKIPPKKT